MNLFVFDIETVPDVDAGRRLYDLDGLDDKDVAEIMFHKQRQLSGNDFLRHHLHRVVAISVALRSGDRFKLWSLGDAGSPEKELIQRFFDGIDRYSPTLVSWNGSGFDLPVLHYRSMLHGVAASRYWETGADDTSFRWNNYLSRYHERHTDLMDVLAGYQPRASAPLEEVALLLGLPGKLGMHGSLVWERFLAGDVDAIRNYCETDVLNTYLVYLRFELVRGHLNEAGYERECEALREALTGDERAHVAEFLSAWSERRAR
ncbi:MAG: 3'-5' exonuclease [Gammaproteobacteria bacterium]|nr:3'-5' exonuclease [Gammaproteobacteria bacterium]NIM72846.1 3'-5' exonuclease [Gammaproteobacteria bacterium]NIN38304.1 3'-5' exonuclease [Gammaproteobacteria bacterium]NIO24594.1 3'-5' exonuclease [Gammaproteobacteria bacterium]NIO65203.1 3'-5' exonuclease [Gammaproteobacteria bacterium]